MRIGLEPHRSLHRGVKGSVVLALDSKRRCGIVVFAALAVASFLAAVCATEASATTPLELLVRHAPLLVLHRYEPFSPTSVEGFIADSDLLVQAPDGSWQPSPLPLGRSGAASRLDQRACRAIDGPAAIGCYASAEAARGSTPTVYGAVFRTRERIALQYWLFYPANVFSPTVPTGLFWQSHEGDWEAVSVLLDRRERPLVIGLSEHCGGARRTWERAPRRGPHPLVYVALGSHANYFGPGAKALDRRCWPTEAVAVFNAYKVPLLDHAGGGRSVLPHVVNVGSAAPAWMAFAGTWGDDQYVHFPDVDPLRFGAGPRGPAFHSLWRSPVATVLGWRPG